MKFKLIKYISRILKRIKYYNTRKELRFKLKFWQHELGYHYGLDLYTLKVISNCFQHIEPLTKFMYHLPIIESDWSD